VKKQNLTYLILAGFYIAVISSLVKFAEIRESGNAKLLEERVQSNLTLLSYELDRFYSRVDEDLNYLERIINFNTSFDVEDYKNTENVFSNFGSSFSSYDQMRILDYKGNELLRVNFNDGAPFIVKKEKMQWKGNRYYFKELLSYPLNKTYYSKIDLNIENGQVEIPLKYVSRVGRRYNNKILILNFKMNSFILFASKLEGYEADYFLFNGDSHIPLNKKITKPLVGSPVTKGAKELVRRHGDKAFVSVVKHSSSNGSQLYLGIGFVTLLFIVIFYYVFKYLSSVTLQLGYMNNLQATKKKLQVLHNQIVDLQELERKQIAQDIHDDLGQLAVSLKINIESYSISKKDEIMITIRSQLKELIAKIQDISRGLRPDNLSHFSFDEVIGELIERSFKESLIKYDYDVALLSSITDEETKINIYRVMQEVISNILKHSNGTHVHIHCFLVEDVLCLEVSNDGRYQNIAGSNQGLGLVSISERMSLINGSMDYSISSDKFTVKLFLRQP
jgi:signal transduction histidine kinase